MDKLRLLQKRLLLIWLLEIAPMAMNRIQTFQRTCSFQAWRGKLYFLVSILVSSRGGMKMDFGAIPGSKYDFARNAANFFYS